MSEQKPDHIWSGIQLTKVTAGTLAAVSAAVIGSFLGVAGTLIGAAVASLVGSVGTELYQRSLDRGARKIKTIAPTFVKAPAAVGTPPVAAATPEESPSDTKPAETEPAESEPAESEPAEGEHAGTGPDEKPDQSTTATYATQPATSTRPLRWRRIALAAGALFVLALASLSVVELLAGRSVASMLGNETARPTTVGSVIGGDTGDRAPDPAPEESTQPDEEPVPTDAPATTEPTTDPTTEPTRDPLTEPTTDAPTTDAPEQTTPTDAPQNEQNPLNQQQEPDTSSE